MLPGHTDQRTSAPLEHADVRPDWDRSVPGGLLSHGPGTAVTAPLVAPVIPSGPARYGWCQNTEG